MDKQMYKPYILLQKEVRNENYYPEICKYFVTFYPNRNDATEEAIKICKNLENDEKELEKKIEKLEQNGSVWIYTNERISSGNKIVILPILSGDRCNLSSLKDPTLFDMYCVKKDVVQFMLSQIIINHTRSEYGGEIDLELSFHHTSDDAFLYSGINYFFKNDFINSKPIWRDYDQWYCGDNSNCIHTDNTKGVHYQLFPLKFDETYNITSDCEQLSRKVWYGY
jgi:hypothetical protein